MELTNILVLTAVLFAASAGAAECEAGWQIYRDELCIKIFPTTFLSYDEAKAFCSSQGSENSKSSLVMVKEADMQELLVNNTGDIYDDMWLGARFDEETAQFLWDDGEPLTYTNWQDGSPRDDSDSNICIDLRPINARQENPQGKWADVNCNKRNLVICQKVLMWTLQDAINEIIKIRKQLVEATDDRDELREELEMTKNSLQQELETTQRNLQTISSRVVPVGSIYIEYSNQPSPVTLWPDLTWEDISSTYAGLFFRASGGGSANWGENQGECAPRISQVEYTGRLASEGCYPWSVNVPATGWSEWVKAGEIFATGTYHCEAMRFNTAGCEVRPKNQAVRIWKRTA